MTMGQSQMQGVTLSDIPVQGRNLHTVRSVLKVPDAEEWELLKLELQILCLQPSCVILAAFR